MRDKKFAVLTGASGGIGREIAKKLKRDGFNLILCGTNTEKLNALSAEIEDSFVVAKDISSFEGCLELSKECLEISGGVEVLVNNAGITRDKLMIRMSEKDFTDVMDINLNSAFYLSKLFLRDMIKNKYGKIINISSVSGISGNAGQTNYSTSKAGLIGLTKAMARELGSKNIMVNAVAPGFIETEMTERIDEEKKNKILNEISLKRFGMAEEVAELVAFLASDKSNYITGEVIKIDGGMI